MAIELWYNISVKESESKNKPERKKLNILQKVLYKKSKI